MAGNSNQANSSAQWVCSVRGPAILSNNSSAQKVECSLTFNCLLVCPSENNPRLEPISSRHRVFCELRPASVLGYLHRFVGSSCASLGRTKCLLRSRVG